MATATFTSSSDSPSLVMMVTTMILIMTATAPSHHFPFLKHLNPGFQWQHLSIIGRSQQSSVVISFGRCEIPFIIIGNTIILVIFIIITIVTSSCLIPFSSSSILPSSPHHNIIITITISSSSISPSRWNCPPGVLAPLLLSPLGNLTLSGDYNDYDYNDYWSHFFMICWSKWQPWQCCSGRGCLQF